jgi:DNA-binding response OmpR family regulator
LSRIAIVEDEADARDQLTEILASRHRVTAFADGSSFLRALHRDTFDLVCVDWALPDMTGQDLVARIRSGALAKTIPIIFVTARSGDDDLVTGLVAGADDFVSKPIRGPIITARVEALLRRTTPEASGQIETYEPFVFDRLREVVIHGDQEFTLTSKEFALALTLFRNMHRPLARSYLMEEVWGAGANVTSRTLDTHICRLKSKLGLNAQNGFNFGPVYGFGYRLERANGAEAGLNAA